MRRPAPITLLLSATLLCCGDPPAPVPDPPKTATTTATTATATVATASATAVAETPPSAEPSAGPTASVVASASAAPDATSRPTSSAAVASATSKPTATASASASAPATASAPDVKGSETKAAAYSAYMSGAGKYKAGETGNVTAVVTSLGEYKVNKEYPFKFTLNAAPAGVSYGETVVRNVSRTEKRASISIPFTPSSAGTATISGTYSLSVCTAEKCLIEKVPLSVTVKVE